MRAFKTIPLVSVHSAQLTKPALKRLAWFDFYHCHNRNISLTCRHFGISRDTFYLWKSKFVPQNLRTLEDNTLNRRPDHLRQMTTDPQILKRIYEVRLDDPSMSKYKIQEQLKREDITISTKVIQKVINRHSELLNTEHKRKLTKSRHHKIARMRAAKELKEKDLGSLIQIDTKHLYVIGEKFYIFAAIDCKSRLGFVFAYTSISSKSAQDFLQRVTSYFPFPISAINTDNGSEYLLSFHELTQKLNIPHYFSYPQTPKNNARVERFIQTLEYEFLHYQNLLPDLRSIQILCEQFNQKYNSQRFHQALHYQTPKEYVTTLLQQKGEQLYVI